MQATMKTLQSEGRTPYFIHVGGSNLVGLWGYFSFVEEVLKQGLNDSFDDIVLPVGSGGTTAAIAIGLHLAGSPVRVHAVNVSNNPAYFHNHIDNTLRELGLSDRLRSRGFVDIIDGYKGQGYGKVTDLEHKVISEMVSHSLSSFIQ
jgi:D-cysteine desulfhydrase